MSRVDRRTFVSLCTTVGLGTAPFLDAVWNQLEATPAPLVADPMMIQQQAPSRITREMVTSAETISGLTFTDDERDMMLQGLNGALTSFERIHAVSLPNSVPPAVHFSPFPAGMAPPLVPARTPAREARTVRRPESPEDLAFMTVAELGELVRTRQVTATDLTRLYLARLKKYNPVLECVVTLTEDRALTQAAVADREIQSGRYRGPLHGIPWGAKDLLTVPGFKTTWGSAIYQDQMLDDIATVVERLDQAGAILVAKLTLGELAMGDVWFGGTTKNPWLTTQGSSGSSAGPGSATAAGLVGFSIGTETLGSIVSPATRNGVSGLRPTYGRVSRHGAMALSWTMDKIGPMCRSAEDCAIVLGAIYGPDGKDPTVINLPYGWDHEKPLSSIRVGYLQAAFEADHPGKAHDDAGLEAARNLGVVLVPVTLPDDLPIAALRIILNAEAAAAFDEVTRTNLDDKMVRQTANAWPNSFRTARFIPAVEYIQANRIRTLLMQRMAAVFQQVDVFITPSFGGNVLLITNLTGHPAIALPSGFTEQGTPVSISFIGNLCGESDLCLVARKWQEATGWHRKRPPGYS